MFKKMSNLLQKISTIAGQIMPLFTLITALYGFFYWLPRLVEQKKIEKNLENGIINAKEALMVLTDAESALQRLHFVTTHHHEERSQAQTQFDASVALNKLYNSLQLLRKYPNIPPKLKWIKTLIQTLDKKEPYVESKSTEVLSKVTHKWFKQNDLDISGLEELREILLKIYEVEEIGKLK